MLSREYCVEHHLKAFCGYVLDSFSCASYHDALEDICRCHSHVAPTRGDEALRIAVDAATQEVVGISLSTALRHSKLQVGWQDRLPVARRTALWLKDNMTGRVERVMRRARELHERNPVQ